jgi:phosphatidylserine decarboxylase
MEARPALVASIIDLTIMVGGTFLQRIRINCKSEIRTPERSAVNHKPMGMKYKMIQRPMILATTITIHVYENSISIFLLLV